MPAIESGPMASESIGLLGQTPLSFSFSARSTKKGSLEANPGIISAKAGWLAGMVTIRFFVCSPDYSTASSVS